MHVDYFILMREGDASALVFINQLASSKAPLWTGNEKITQIEDKRNVIASSDLDLACVWVLEGHSERTISV